MGQQFSKYKQALEAMRRRHGVNDDDEPQRFGWHATRKQAAYNIAKVGFDRKEIKSMYYLKYDCVNKLGWR